MEFIEYDKMT
jgi:MoxR-like ATPase